MTEETVKTNKAKQSNLFTITKETVIASPAERDKLREAIQSLSFMIVGKDTDEVLPWNILEQVTF